MFIYQNNQLWNLMIFKNCFQFSIWIISALILIISGLLISFDLVFSSFSTFQGIKLLLILVCMCLHDCSIQVVYNMVQALYFLIGLLCDCSIHHWKWCIEHLQLWNYFNLQFYACVGYVFWNSNIWCIYVHCYIFMVNCSDEYKNSLDFIIFFFYFFI